MTTSKKASLLEAFEEHLRLAENSKKPLNSRLLHAELAQIYYDLYRNAPLETYA